MEQFILKEKIKECVKDRKITAAVFYTFNFDPIFFENYVMPMFVPDQNFRDEMIYNKVLWRHCMKDNLIPPISVFCDYYAKDNTVAPSLGYDIHCIKTPALKGYICNFHPKNIFLLLEDAKGNESLLFITGSGNMTAGGWCDNFECFSIEELKKDRTYPNKTTTNELQDFINGITSLAGIKHDPEAVDLIYNFLRYTDFRYPYFNSMQTSFTDFLDTLIFSREYITEAEIISPFFSNDLQLLESLKERGIRKISCLIPTLKSNEILVDKETFVALQAAGLKWSDWKDAGLRSQTRIPHAKIYRFYSENKVYTILGSVNFTNPAWIGYTSRNNKANIESAILYKESNTDKKILKERTDIDIDALRFYEREDLENPDEVSYGRDAPDLEFIIDWENCTLQVIAKNLVGNYYFEDILNKQVLSPGKYTILLSAADVRSLSRNSLIRIATLTETGVELYTYYAQHVNFETKPLGFRLDAATIIRYWQDLDDPFLKEMLGRQIAEQVTDDSGVTNDKLQEKKSLLNAMAAHFAALIGLEKKLFKVIPNKGDQRKQFTVLRYYLLSENIDTLSFYFEDITQQLQEERIQKSFYWMIAHILITQFYKRALKWDYRSEIPTEEWRPFREGINNRMNALKDSVAAHTRDIKGFETTKQEWVLEQLADKY